ncbi:uncharacterized protein LOC117329163 [Pecten maximus]|uniref:uncharacterized protein LOC117329163 n=1 Tax=Pecten maximus TaxID=6579 RepID=UPI0014583B81|nr:uncharacterized protein LOC117329163 [Pecten maximus]
MDFLPLALLGILAFCDGVLAARDIDEHDIFFGPNTPGNGDGNDWLPPSQQECEHLHVDIRPMTCSDFFTRIPRSSAFLWFIDAAHFLLSTDQYYFLWRELAQIPIPEKIPEPVSTSRDCKTESKLLLGYWEDYGEICWIVWAGRQDVRCAECVNDYCCREFNKTEPNSLLPPTSRCKLGGHTIQKFIVYCAYLYGNPYGGYFMIKYTYLPSCCECKNDICTSNTY